MRFSKFRINADLGQRNFILHFRQLKFIHVVEIGHLVWSNVCFFRNALIFCLAVILVAVDLFNGTLHFVTCPEFIGGQHCFFIRKLPQYLIVFKVCILFDGCCPVFDKGVFFSFVHNNLIVQDAFHYLTFIGPSGSLLRGVVHLFIDIRFQDDLITDYGCDTIHQFSFLKLRERADGNKCKENSQ